MSAAGVGAGRKELLELWDTREGQGGGSSGAVSSSLYKRGLRHHLAVTGIAAASCSSRGARGGRRTAVQASS